MIYVDIEKNFGKFNLKTKFEFDNEIMGLLGVIEFFLKFNQALISK